MNWWVGPLIHGFVWGLLTVGLAIGVLMTRRSGSSRAQHFIGLGIFWAILQLIIAVAGIVFEHIPMKGGYVAVGSEARLCGVESLLFGCILLSVSIIPLKVNKGTESSSR